MISVLVKYMIELYNLPNELKEIIFDYVYINYEGCVCCGDSETHWLPSCEKCNKGLCEKCHTMYEQLGRDKVKKYREQCTKCTEMCDECINQIFSDFENKKERYVLCQECERMCDECKKTINDVYNGCLNWKDDGDGSVYKTYIYPNGKKSNRLYGLLDGGWLCECNNCECRKNAITSTKKQMNFLKLIEVQEVYDKSIDYAVGWCIDCLKHKPSYIVSSEGLDDPCLL